MPRLRTHQAFARKRIVWAAIVGISANVLVAWGVSLLMPAYHPREPDPALLEWPIDVPGGWPEHPTSEMRYAGIGLDHETLSEHLTTTQSHRQHFVHAETKAGWPMRSMRSVYFARTEYAPAAPIVTHQRGGVLGQLGVGIPARALPGWVKSGIPHTLGEYRIGVRVIPLVPAPAGFAINSVVFASVVWCVLVLRCAFTNRALRRKGRCVRCGHDRATLSPPSACPECGHTPGA